MATALLSTTLAVALFAWIAVSSGTASPLPVAGSGTPNRSSSPSASPSVSTSPSPSVPPESAVPLKGDGTFAANDKSGAVIGTGSKLIRYRVEVERGIAWGELTPWTPASFAATVDAILAAPQGWTWSAQHPVTNSAVHLTNASWRFQRVATSEYQVRIRLATPTTVDTACGKAGLDTAGVYSCRVGSTILINLRRWLTGAAGFPVTIEDYRTGVINHEVGHFLGFDHMKCPGPGQPAPVMNTQTRDREGCVPNPHPFAANGTFVTGAWQPS